MKKVLSTAVLCALLTLSIFFAGCKNSVSSGGGNSGGGEIGQEYNPPEKQIPLTLEAIEDGFICFANLEQISGLKYTINDYAPVEITETSGNKDIPVSSGDIVRLFAQGISNNTNYVVKLFRIGSSSDCYVYGNVMSLITDNFQNETTITQRGAFAYLFDHSIYIKNHPEKNLVLPATILTSSCYQGMFRGCTSITTSPVLPATTLTWGCYKNMFDGCSSLKKVECLATDISADSCTTGWLDRVASTGTFIKAAGMNDWPTGIDGIPSGWTVEEK